MDSKMLNLRAEAAAAHLCPCCYSPLLLAFEKKWSRKKSHKTLNVIESRKFEGFLLTKNVIYKNMRVFGLGFVIELLQDKAAQTQKTNPY